MTDEAAPAPMPPLAWIDMEMSGLDPESCGILEVALILTDGDLNEIATGPHFVVHQPEPVLALMDDWNVKHHGKSGLTKAVRESTVSVADAEAALVGFLEANTKKGASPLCGNSVYVDRRFLAAHMPALDVYLHYRIIDVSTVKELAKRWFPELPHFQKREAHRALDDIRESIAELRYYREHVFKSTAAPVSESNQNRTLPLARRAGEGVGG